MSISERIALIIHTHQMTNSTFADKLDIQRSSVSHVLSGRNKPSLDFLAKVVQHFPRVDANWLLTGVSGAKNASETNQNSKNETITEAEAHDSNKERKIKKIIHYYTDNSFEEFHPSGQ